MSEQPELAAAPVIEWTGERAPFAKAFVAAQKATEAVKKASSNPAFRSKYADLAGVVEAVVPALNSHGIGVIQLPTNDGELVGLTTELLHESGASVRCTLKMRPTKNDPQGVGSAITYARRYSLLAMTGAAPEDDDGNAASSLKPEGRPEPKRTEPQAPTLAQRADRLAATLEGVKTADELEKAYRLASGLCADLDAKDPERLAEINALYERRQDELTRKVAA